MVASSGGALPHDQNLIFRGWVRTRRLVLMQDQVMGLECTSGVMYTEQKVIN